MGAMRKTKGKYHKKTMGGIPNWFLSLKNEKLFREGIEPRAQGEET